MHGRLIGGNRGGELFALEPATGTVAWNVRLWGSAIESVAVPAAGGLFYIGSSDLRRVALMDAKDARVVWRTDVYGWPWARPELAGGRLYASAVGADPYEIRHLGSLTALDARSGQIVWRWQMPAWPGAWLNGFAASPAATDDRLVVGGLDGTLYAFPLP